MRIRSHGLSIRCRFLICDGVHSDRSAGEAMVPDKKGTRLTLAAISGSHRTTWISAARKKACPEWFLTYV